MSRFAATIVLLVMAFPVFAGGKATAFMALNVGGLNVRFIEMLMAALAFVYVHPSRAQRVPRLTQRYFLLMFLVMVAGLFVGVQQGARTTDVLNDARAFGTILLYFPLRRVVMTCQNEERILNRVLLGIVALVLISAVVFFAFPSYVLEMNEGAFGERSPRLLIVNSFAETLFLSSFVVTAMFSRGRVAAVVNAGLFVLVLVAVYVYGFRSLFVIFLLQVAVAALIWIIERRSSPVRPLKWAAGITAVGVLVYFTGIVKLRDDQVERLQSLATIVTDGLQSADPNESVFTRMATFERLYEDVQDRPVLGRGFGYIAPMYGYSGDLVQESLVIDSSYMYLLVKMGVLGLAAFVVLIGVLLVRGVRVAMRSGGFWNRVFLLFGVSLLLSGITESAIIRSNAGWILLILWGLLLERSAAARPTEPALRPARRRFTLRYRTLAPPSRAPVGSGP
jgi:hypothetical protein